MTLVVNKVFAGSVAGLLLIFSMTFAVSPVFANQHQGATGGLSGVGVSAGTPSPRNTIQNPLSGISTVSQFVEAILKGILAIGMPVAVFFIVLSGFRFIAAQGNQEKLSDAKNNFMWTIIGVAIFIGAWTLATLIASTLKQIGAGA